jgi:hypothetical protein
MTDQPKGSGCGCVIWFLTLFTAIALIFVHPLAAIAVLLIGLALASTAARLELGPGMWTDPQYSSQRPAAPIVYRREVTVSETIYQRAEFRPRREIDQYQLKGIFGKID